MSRSTASSTGIVEGRAERIQGKQWIGVLVMLFKLRVVALLLLAALGGAILAAGGPPSFGQVALLLMGETCFSDIVYLKNGQKMEGVTQEGPGGIYFPFSSTLTRFTEIEPILIPK